MKIDKKNEGDCRVRLSITAPAEETNETYNKILSRYLRNSQLRGFRKGKAPKDVVLRAYAPQIQAEVRGTLCSDLTNKAIDQEGLVVAALVGFRDVEFAPENGISFSVIIETAPEFKAPKYKGLPLKYTAPTATEEEVEKQLDAIRHTLDTTAESTEPMKEGDYANISFTSDLDDVAEGDAAARYVKNDNFWLQVGEHPAYEALPGSAKALLGLKTGDEFTFVSEFPGDFSVESLRGKKASYKGKILKVNAVVPTSDEQFCTTMACKSVDEIRNRVRDRILAGREQDERKRLHDEIDALFLKKADFAVPETIVQIAMTAIGNDVANREIQGKVSSNEEAEQYVKDHIEELRAKIKDEATGLVRLNFIGQALAKELDITATENDVKAEMESAAQYYARRDSSITGEKLFTDAKKKGQVAYYQDRIRYARVVDWIIDNDLKPAAK